MQIETVIVALTDTRQNLEALKTMPDVTPDTLDRFTAFVIDLESTVDEILADTPPKNGRELDVAIARATENIHQSESFRRAMDSVELRGSPDESIWINTTNTCIEALKWHLHCLIEARVRLGGTGLEVKSRFAN